MSKKEKFIDLGINKDVFQDRLASIIVWFFFLGVLPALFLAYVWIGFKVFDYIKDLLEDTFLEGFAFVTWAIIWFVVLVGSVIIYKKMNDWWTLRKKNSAEKM